MSAPNIDNEFFSYPSIDTINIKKNFFPLKCIGHPLSSEQEVTKPQEFRLKLGIKCSIEGRIFNMGSSFFEGINLRYQSIISPNEDSYLAKMARCQLKDFYP